MLASMNPFQHIDTPENLTQVLALAHAESMPVCTSGSLATYIPALSSANPNALGLALCTDEGQIFQTGQADCRFSMQSISKVFALAYVMAELGEEAVFSRVGKEPTGDPFNSIIRLETSARRKPFNPFINAGAIVISDLMPGTTPADKAAGFRRFVGSLVGRTDVEQDDSVYVSEKASAARNRAIAWFLKELGLISGEVEDTLDTYFRQCATLVDALDLARAGACLALDGVHPLSGKRALPENCAHTVKSLMVTCGLYDGSGEFAVSVGIPAKSGVGGGIMAAVRDRMGIGVYGPALDGHGNSAAGLWALGILSRQLDLRVL